MDSVFCNCTEDRMGDNCLFVYRPSDVTCITETDCGGSSRGVCENGKCVCHLGFRGDRCEIKTRVFLEEQGRCENGGTPYKQGHTFGCFCRCGFTGENCGNLAPEALTYGSSCDTKICNGNGFCVSGESPCYCPMYSDKFCENALYGPDTTPAVPNPSETTHTSLYPSCRDYGASQCKNGGLCMRSFETGIKHCLCPPDYEGDLCEVEVNPVSPNEGCVSGKRCLNGGLCANRLYEKICICEPCFFGPNCEYSTDHKRSDYRYWCYFENYTCSNGGSCVVTEDTCEMKCLCQPLYTGTHCQYRITTMDTSQTTEKCPPYIGCGSYYCREGMKCVVDRCGTPYCVDDGPEKSPNYSIAASVSLVFVVLVITISCSVSVYIRRRKRRREPPGSRDILNYINTLQGPSAPNSVRLGQIVNSNSPVYLELSVTQLGNTTLPTYAEACERPPAYSEIANDTNSRENESG